MNTKEPVRPVGRPTVMTAETLQKLREAFLNSATDEEACLVAGISPGTLYNYQEDNPGFLEEKELLKKDTNYRARANIVKAVREGNISQSNWWAERKNKEEFSGRTELTGKDGGQLFDLTTVLNELNAREEHPTGSQVEEKSE